MVIIKNGYFGADVKCHLYCMDSCKRGTYRQVGKYPQKVTRPEIFKFMNTSKSVLKMPVFLMCLSMLYTTHCKFFPYHSTDLQSTVSVA